MLGLGRREGAEQIGGFVLHHGRKSQPPTISLSSFFSSSPANRAPPPAKTGGGSRARSSRRREAPAAPSALSSRGGLRKRASSHGDEETFMACDRICACCKRVFYVFQMFHKDVASVSCGCCKSRSGCFSVPTRGRHSRGAAFPMLHEAFRDVSSSVI
jgi:hypothetical protein